mmetsp:Transcript_52/g.89  ORF Transcript_52/g.89 Transcript_52/m.89 type:complete len:512 (-) Transcript_52:252-1787(-)|eukprot:CAMPEP_0204827538 /NCGR_PEP_ID=MMETSP1346-20131115/4972_1 /ASSEMBLY_ACC=CAM_ASM_000771 /TAXON_ID=215587 /ORGANISM="Aplanochytrium stocchinoi, Strain GSBS06" /LENGTH=511 /DNA_ID=CAMNT_0051955993 /DNA_START=39 /DNA_END=1574 /DNA_ORIENTATION=-
METAALHYKGVNLGTVLGDVESPRKTKIVCTIGPSSDSVEKLSELIKEGMTVARLNFSHGDHDSQLDAVKNIQEASQRCPGTHTAILLDTKGPEIRTGFLKEKKVKLRKGQLVEVVTDYNIKGDETVIACSYKGLPHTVAEGDTILCADGSLSMKVVEVKSESVKVEMLNSGVLGERKNMNLPGNKVDLPTITKKDHKDIAAFAQHIDFVAASFVQNASDIDDVREALGSAGSKVKIIAKIENQEGLRNFDSILEAADGIMIARGDLGMEIPLPKVFLAQKLLIRKCNLAGKFVITATQMLESMVHNPRPTRAETTDVANAVLDGTDCVMLSGETAGGDYPTEAVKMISSICREAESIVNHKKLYFSMVSSVNMETVQAVNAIETVASSVVKTSLELHTKMIIIVSENGYAAGLVAKYRPECPILVVTSNLQLARQVHGIGHGTHCLHVKKASSVDKMLAQGAEKGKELGWVTAGDSVVTLHRFKATTKHRHLMEVFKVPEKKNGLLQDAE